MIRPAPSVRNWKVTLANFIGFAPLAALALLLNYQVWFHRQHPPPVVGVLFLPMTVFACHLAVRALTMRVAVEPAGIRVWNYMPRSVFIPWDDYLEVAELVGFGRAGAPYWTMVVKRVSGKPVKVVASAWWNRADMERFVMRTRALIREYRPVST